MARRSRLTHVGLLSFDDLDELGVGRNEGWLADPSVHAAIQPPHLAVAKASIAAVLRWDESDAPSPPVVKIRPTLLPSIEGEISAVEWIAFGDLVALAIGTSGGYLLLYSPENRLVHKQIVHNGCILRLRFREVVEESVDGGEVLAQELCVVLPGVVARFDGSDIKICLDRWDQRMEGGDGSGSSFEKIPYRIWNVSKFGSCADAAITGLMPPPLLELQSEQRHYCVVAVGNDAVISAYRVSERRSRSLVVALLRNVVPVAVSTISSFTKRIWRSQQASVEKPEPATRPFTSTPLTCLKDHPRKGEKLTLSPSGTLAVITDSLGRISLLDTQALVVVRLWKGYRDACCLFMEMLIRKDTGKSTSASYSQGYTKSHYCLCLAIHAPRKGIIEVWKMRTGPRVFTIQCPKGSKILQPSSRRASLTDMSLHVPLEVFLLNGESGQLSVLNKSIG